MPSLALPLASFGGAIEFIFTPQPSNVTGGELVGGFSQSMELLLTQIEVTLLALALALLVGLPLGLYLGHRGRGEQLAGRARQRRPGDPRAGADRAGRDADRGRAASPSPRRWRSSASRRSSPTPTSASARSSPAAVAAARGMGMTELEVIRRVELPLAIPTIMGGVRSAAIVIVATATIAPLAGVVTLGDYIINESIYGPDGVLAGAILVALLALALELSLAGLQRLLTSKGLKLQKT